MEITKTHHESGTGIHALSSEVKTKKEWEAAEVVAEQMIEWLNENNGNFKGQHSNALAMAHCQVVEHDQPYKLFVVNKELVVPQKLDKDSKETLENTYFEAQAIFNAEVLETPEKITKLVPKRTIEKEEDGTARVHVSGEEKELDNVITVPEGCMSFPNRKAKNCERFYKIKARYQYIGKNMFGKPTKKTFEGWVHGMKAHIIQHETEHFKGVNIFHK